MTESPEPPDLEGDIVTPEWLEKHGVKIDPKTRELISARHALIRIDGRASFADDPLESEIEISPSGFSGDRFGYYADIKYHFWPKFLNGTFLATGFESPELILVGRAETVVWEDYVEQVTILDGGVFLDREDRTQDRYTLALAYRPVPDWVFSLAWEYSLAKDGEALLFPDTGKRSLSTWLAGMSFAF